MQLWDHTPVKISQMKAILKKQARKNPLPKLEVRTYTNTKNGVHVRPILPLP